MPLQEFLASYAVQVDEDGARRLQAILDKNRDSGQQLATVFESAYTALTLLKKELSDANGLKNLFSDLSSFTIPKISTASLPDLSGGLNRAGASLSGGSSVLSVSADMTSAEKSLTSFRSRLEAEKPKLSANPTGITSAVSSAIASIRAMMSSVRLTIPVTAVAQLDTSSLPVGGTTRTSSNTRTTANSRTGYTVTPFGEGGRVSQPTLAMIAEEGEPEYVIPTDNDARAVPLLQSLLSELSESAKSKLFSLPDGIAGNLLAAKHYPEAETARDAESVSEIGKITLPASLQEQPDLSSVLRKMAESFAGLKELPELFAGWKELPAPSIDSSKSPDPSADLQKLSAPSAGQQNRPDFAASLPDRSALLSGNLASQSSRLPSPPTDIPLDSVRNALADFASAIHSIRIPDLPFQTAADALADLTAEARSFTFPVLPFQSAADALADLSTAARSAFLPAGAAMAPSMNTVQAPVTINVTSAAAAPEAVARSLYDTAQRSLLKTMKGVFV